MEISTIKKSLKKFGLNFNNKIVKAIEDIHKDSSITEITANNLEEVIASTDSIVIKLGLDGEKADTLDFNNNSPLLCLCYAKIKNKLIELPINYIDNFIKNYIPINVFTPNYSTSEQIPGAPEGFNSIPIINTTSNTVNIGGITFTYNSTISSFGILTNLDSSYRLIYNVSEEASHLLITYFMVDKATILLSASQDYINGFIGIPN